MTYSLYLSLDTDDDCQLMYQGKPYCFYGDYLVINRMFPTKGELIGFLEHEITVCEGHKCSEYTQSFIDEAIVAFKQYGKHSECWVGNQTFTIDIRENN